MVLNSANVVVVSWKCETWRLLSFIYSDFARFNQKSIWKWNLTWHYSTFEISFNYAHRKETIRNYTYPSLQNGIYLETGIKIQNICISKLRKSQNFRYGFVLAPFFRHVRVATFCQDGCWYKDPKVIKWNYTIRDKVGSTINLGKLKYLSLFICFNWFVMLLFNFDFDAFRILDIELLLWFVILRPTFLVVAPLLPWYIESSCLIRIKKMYGESIQVN